MAKKLNIEEKKLLQRINKKHLRVIYDLNG
jgi:hypothetical protein